MLKAFGSLGYIGGLILGICLAMTGGALDAYMGDAVKAVSGMLLGVGMSVVSVCGAGLYAKRLERKNPEMAKWEKIETEDERNIFIRIKSKAKSADITQWLVLGVLYVNVLTDGPFWMSALLLGVFLAYTIITFYFLVKFQKEM